MGLSHELVSATGGKFRIQVTASESAVVLETWKTKIGRNARHGKDTVRLFELFRLVLVLLRKVLFFRFRLFSGNFDRKLRTKKK